MTNQSIEIRINNILQDKIKYALILDDLSRILCQFGLNQEKSSELCNTILLNYLNSETLEEGNKFGWQLMQKCKVLINGFENPILKLIQAEMAKRPKDKFLLLKPYLQNLKGKTIDYGAGDGVFTQNIAGNLKLDIEGVDIRSAKAPNVTIPMLQFDGAKVPVFDKYYDNGLLIQVLHHAENYPQILVELDRIVKHNLIVRENTPVGNDDNEMRQNLDRIFMLDFLYAKIFCNSNMPTPGTFFTPKDWIKMFAKYGWQCVAEIDEGFDQVFQPFRHGLWIFKR